MINSLRFVTLCVYTLWEEERGGGSTREKNKKDTREREREREEEKKKKRTCHSIFRVIVLFAFIVANRYEVSDRAMSTAIQMIQSFSVPGRWDRFSLVYTKLLHMTNRRLLPFNLLRSASFASHHLPNASRFTHTMAMAIELNTSTRDSSTLCLLLCRLLYFSNLVLLLLSFSRYLVFVLFVYFHLMCHSPRDRCMPNRVDNPTARVCNREVNHVP